MNCNLFLGKREHYYEECVIGGYYVMKCRFCGDIDDSNKKSFLEENTIVMERIRKGIRKAKIEKIWNYI